MQTLSKVNSFSRDAQRYLNDIATANGEDLKYVNPCIGGYSFRQHYPNMLDDEACYMFEFNGAANSIYISIRKDLKSDVCDYVTFQQAGQYNI